MAERLKEKLLENGMADLVVGPDAYRDLPQLVTTLLTNEEQDTAVNVQLSLEETYAEITPVRRNSKQCFCLCIRHARSATTCVAIVSFPLLVDENEVDHSTVLYPKYNCY